MRRERLESTLENAIAAWQDGVAPATVQAMWRREGGGVSEAPSYEDIVRALRTRLAGAPQLQDQPVRDIGHDLTANGYLPTEPDPALVRRALVQIKDEGGVA